MGKPEAQIEGYLVARVTAMGGDTRKATWIGRRGCPDRFVMLPGEISLNFWAECKRPGGVLEPHQVREIARMRAAGEVVCVFDSKEAIDDVLAGRWRGHAATRA